MTENLIFSSQKYWYSYCTNIWINLQHFAFIFIQYFERMNTWIADICPSQKKNKIFKKRNCFLTTSMGWMGRIIFLLEYMNVHTSYWVTCIFIYYEVFIVHLPTVLIVGGTFSDILCSNCRRWNYSIQNPTEISI